MRTCHSRLRNKVVARIEPLGNVARVPQRMAQPRLEQPLA
jgi:hypothetical protein